MKKTVNNIFRRGFAILLSLSLLLGAVTPLLSFAAGATSALDGDGNGEINYLAIGSEDTLGSYPETVKAGLATSSGKQVKNTVFAFSKMRIEELLYLLDEDFSGDEYTAANFLSAGGAFANGAGATLRDKLVNDIGNAEILSLDLSFDSFATYALSYIFSGEYAADFTRFDEGMQRSIAEIKGRFDDVIGGYFEDPTNKNGEEVASFAQRAIDGLAYALVSYCYSFDRVLSEIYAINPKVKVVAVSARNPMTSFSAKMSGLGIEIPLDLVYGIIVDIANVYMASLSEYSGAFYFAYFDGSESKRGVLEEITAYNGQPSSLSDNAKEMLLHASGLDTSESSEETKLSVINTMAQLAKLGTKETVIDITLAALAKSPKAKVDAIIEKAFSNPAFNPLTSAEYKAIEADKASLIHLAAMARYRLGGFASLLDEKDGEALGKKIVDAINGEILGKDAVKNEMNGIYSFLSDYFDRETLLDLEYTFKPYYTCDQKSYYLALGDDSAYDEYDRSGNLKRGSYASKLADRLVTEHGFNKGRSYKNFAAKGETPDELLDLLENGLESSDKKTKQRAEDIIKNLEKANLITISYTNLETTKFMLNPVGKTEWEELLGEEFAQLVLDVKEMLVTEMGKAGIPAFALGEIIPFMERYAFAYAKRVISYVKLLEKIRSIAPDALVVIVGTYNDMENFTLSLGEKELPVGNYVQYLIDAANLETLGYAALKDKTAYIAAPDVQTIHEKNGGDIKFNFATLLTSLGSIVNNGNLLPSDAGHKYIADMVVETVNLIEAHECEFDNACDNRCDKCKTKREVPGHVYSAVCDANCNECGALRLAEQHKYTADCDGSCNVCLEVREASAHSYSSECDTSCNLCKETRPAKKEHSFTDWKKNGNKEERSCTLCGYSEEKDAKIGAVAIVLISLGGAIVLGGGGFAAFFFGVKKKSLADLVAIFRKKTK